MFRTNPILSDWRQSGRTAINKAFLLTSRVWAKRSIRRLTMTLVAGTVLLAIICWSFGIRSRGDALAFYGMATECDPVWQDLAMGRIHENQPVAEAIAQTEPTVIIRHGPYVELIYNGPLSFTGLSILARDGKLITAGSASCTWEFTFFDGMSPDKWKDYATSRKKGTPSVELDTTKLPEGSKR